MANPDHLAILKQGVGVWEEWRRNNQGIDPDLSGANLGGADLSGAYLSGATLYETVLGATNLSEAKGLTECVYRGPCTIDHRTLEISGPLPEVFLRGCGLPDNLIDYLPSLLAQPIQFNSCFISYSSKDQDFAERLHADLQAKGVRCWFAPEDMKIGDKIRDRIDQAIHVHDKLLLILSDLSTPSIAIGLRRRSRQRSK